MMFYEGDLQSGITLAVREAKSVICFVRGSSFIPAPLCSQHPL